MVYQFPAEQNIIQRVAHVAAFPSAWYVLQVSPGKEKFIKELIDREFNHEIQTLVFTREISHKKGPKYVTLITPIFPGYIFIKDNIQEVADMLRRSLHDIFFKAVSFGNGPAKVVKEEMQLLLLHSDATGRFTMSYGFREGEKIIITQGPLKNIHGSILFVNEKKRKAKVRLMLFKKEMEISLGVELLGKSREQCA